MTTINNESETTESNSNQSINYEISTIPPPSKKFKLKIKNIPKVTTYQLLVVKTIGIFFIILGTLVISHIIGGTQKLGIILILVGVIFTFFISIKKPLMNDKELYIALALSIWIIASYFITFQAESEIFFILIFLGFLIITELSQEYITKNFQKRLNVLLFFFLMVFLLIIAEKIAIILRS